MADALCYLQPQKARLIFALLSFGGFFLYILLGNYSYLPSQAHHGGLEQRAAVLARSPQARGWAPVLGGSRRLLSTVSSNESETGNCSTFLLVTKDGETVDVSENSCSDLQKLNNESSACDFVRCVDSCANEDGLINYLQFVYCQVPSRYIIAVMVFLFLWLVFLFIVLGATAEEYFCPALTVMSQVLHLSQNVAGVTLLALGNGSPDIFSAFAAINQDDDKKSSLAVGALFGAGIFVTTIVVGAVTITKPFTLTQRPFLRDIIFYMFAAYWTFYLLWTGYVNIYNAVGFVAFYAFYVAVVIVGRIVFQKWKKVRRNRRLGTGDIPKPPAKPIGEEMSVSEKTPKKKKKKEGSSVADEGLRGLFTRLPLPGVNGHPGGSLNIQDSDEGEREKLLKEEEEDSPEDDKKVEKLDEESREARLFRIQSVGSSELSASGAVPRPVIQVTVEDSVEHGKPTEHKEREGSPVVPTSHLLPSRPNALDIPTDQRARGGSAGPRLGGYGSIQSSGESVKRRSPSHSPSHSPASSPRPGRRRMRKTISGALDIMDEIGAAVAIPHSPQVWEEVHRIHHARPRSRSSRSHTRSAIHEVSDEERGESSSSSSEEEAESEEESGDEHEETPLFKLKHKRKPNQFLKALSAFWIFGETFKELGIFNKIIEIVKIPATLLLTLTVPIVDHNEDDHNWNKWLNVIHCVTGPMFIALVTQLRNIWIAGVFPIWGIILILSVIVAVVVAVTSKPERPPIYHCAFAWLGFAVSIVWIYSIANEIVNLLQVFGIVMKLSDGILGLTLLAWGNSIGDAVSNMTMARQGFPRMAIGACFGGPLLNMLLGIGIASVVKTIRRKAKNFQFELIFTEVELLAAAFLIFNLALSLVVIAVLKFRLKRFYGVYLIAYYIIFLALAVMAEFNVFTINIRGVIDTE